MKPIHSIALFAALCAAWSGCERDEVLTLEDIAIEDKGADVGIVVEPDDGLTRVNSLIKAIEENGSGTYILRRGGTYYIEGKSVCKYHVVVKAEPGTDDLPRIQPISDNTGAPPNYLFQMEADGRFEDVYILGRDAATGYLQDRSFLLNKPGLRLEFDRCYVEGGTSAVIRIQAKDCRVFILNSVLRNVSNRTSPDNGRLIDTRSNNQDSLVIRNSQCYNNTGQMVRHAGAYTNYFELSGNTFWNQANIQNIDCPHVGVIENNIFANYAWKPAKTATAAIWDFDLGPIPADLRPTMKLTVRNNNFFDTADLDACFSLLPAGAYRRTALTNAVGEQMLADGRFVYENNISEVLAFDYAPPLPLDWVKYFISNNGSNMSTCTEWFDVDEDGLEGIVINNMFSFGYPASSRSATASTTGGPLGAQWH